MNRFDKSSYHKLGQESAYHMKKNPFLIWNEHTTKLMNNNKLPTIEEKSIDLLIIYKTDEKFVDEIKPEPIKIRPTPTIDKFLKPLIKIKFNQ